MNRYDELSVQNFVSYFLGCPFNTQAAPIPYQAVLDSDIGHLNKYVHMSLHPVNSDF